MVWKPAKHPVKQWKTVELPETPAAELWLDGSCNPNPGPMGLGYVINTVAQKRNRGESTADEGKPRVIARVGAQIGQGTNNEAEYQALLAGLRHALRLGLWDVRVRSDSLLLVNQVKGLWRARDYTLARLRDEAGVLLGLLNDYEIHHVHREDNAGADELSRQLVYEEPDLGPRTEVKGNERALYDWQAAAVLVWWHNRGARTPGILARIFDTTPDKIGQIVAGTRYRDVSFQGLPAHETPALIPA